MVPNESHDILRIMHHNGILLSDDGVIVVWNTLCLVYC